jgi:hypothetical protein
MRVEYGGHVFMLFEERFETLDQVKQLTPHQLHVVYRSLTDGEAGMDDPEQVVWVVQGQLQLDWMKARFPDQHERIETMAKKQEARVNKAKNPDPDGTGATKTGKGKAKKAGPTLKDSIRGMLLEGKSDEAIIKMIETKFPDSGTARNPKIHIAFYKTQLRREGHTIQQPEKKKKAPVKKAAKDASDKEFVAANS